MQNVKKALSSNIDPTEKSRTWDIIVSSLGILLLAPFFIVIGFINVLLYRGSIFAIEERIGREGRNFKLYRFRTTRVPSNQQNIADRPQESARETTWVGQFLERTGLKNVPMLFNIFKGDMSLIGPTLEIFAQETLLLPEQKRILLFRPGLTSPGSIYYRGDAYPVADGDSKGTTNNQTLSQKISLDLKYLRNRTIRYDLSLLFQYLLHALYRSSSLNNLLFMRNRYIFLSDLVLIVSLPFFSLLLIDIKSYPFTLVPELGYFTAVAIVVKLSLFYKFGFYNRYWRFAGPSDLLRIALACGVATVMLLSLFAILKTLPEPGVSLGAITVSFILIDGLLTILVCGGSRFAIRGLYESIRQWGMNPGGESVLIVGAGEAGSMAVREIQANPQINLLPEGFVDDDPAKAGVLIQGLPVLGTTDDILELVKQHHIKKVIVAIPSAPFSRQHELMTRYQGIGLDVWNFPGLYKILAGHKTIKQIPTVNYNKLLNRKPVTVAMDEVARTLQGKTVMVTGAGGSIGSELCRQIASFGPEKMILLGHGENSIFEANVGLRLAFPNLKTSQAILDVRNKKGIDRIVSHHQPDIIFHAAAHKHVPLMEANIGEAVTNNILGTWNMVRAAQKHNVEKFLLISSDKAVNPVNVMGATKRVAELLVKAAAQESGRNYMAVRFGNVLGSRGSVLPLFIRQIEAGGPLTVTHPDMRRYFMTIPEAVQLVLLATTLSKKCEIFTLDMGEQVRIMALAENLLSQAGLKQGYDIDIIISGARPGEKIKEELFLQNETYDQTKYPKIYASASDLVIDAQQLEEETAVLIKLAKKGNFGKVVKQMQKIVPEYRPIDAVDTQIKPDSPKPELSQIVARMA